jgi:hypothetical protein
MRIAPTFPPKYTAIALHLPERFELRKGDCFMKTRTWSSLILLAALAAPGCRMCCPSYDYCGPTEPGESNNECCGMQRRGSILGGMPVYTEGEYVEGETIIEETPSAPIVTPPAPIRTQPEPPMPQADRISGRRMR